MTKKVIYLVEGETEEALIKALISNNTLEHGRVIIFNCWDGKAESIARRLSTSESNKIYIVFDTDVTNRAKNFVHTVNYIIRYSYQVVLLQQTKNLEEELVYSCSQIRTENKLYFHFNAQGPNQFKKEFLRVSNRLERLYSLGFDCDLMWRRELHATLVNRISKKNVKVGL